MLRLDRDRDLAAEVTQWAKEHPTSPIEQAVSDLGICTRAEDRDAQWLVWRHLPEDHPAWVAFPRG